MRYVEVRCGVFYDAASNKFRFEFDTDSDEDLISLNDSLHKSNVFDDVYWYGYEFKPRVPTSVRTEFLKQIKGLSETRIDDLDFKRFLVAPVIQLGHQELYKFDTLIYPRSERSEINRILVKYVHAYARIQSKDFISLELVKSLPKHIGFNWEAFERDNAHDMRYEIWKRRAEKLTSKINKSTEYFSLAKSVPSNMRRYITNFLHFDDAELQHAKECIDDKDILLVDDVNTSGSTLIECLKAIHATGFPKRIVILTLLGKPFSDLQT